MLKLFHLRWLCLTTLAGSIGRRCGSGIVSALLYPFKLVACMIFLVLVEFFLGSRGRIIIFSYAWLRNLDDIIDDDIPAPSELSLTQFLDERELFIRGLYRKEEKSVYSHDQLIITAMSECRHLDLNICGEIVELWYTMMADYHRRVNSELSTKCWLINQASALDNLIIGTCAKVLGGDVKIFSEVMSEFPGLFTRTDWLHDMPEDLKKNVFNIPSEIFLFVDFDPEILKTCNGWPELLANDHFKQWYIAESSELYRRWFDLDIRLGDDFGGVFKNRTKAFIFKKVMNLWFNRSEVSARRELEGDKTGVC